MPAEQVVSLTEVRSAEALRLKNERERIELMRAKQIQLDEIHARTADVFLKLDEASTKLGPAGKAFFEKAAGSGMTAADVLGMQSEAERRGISIDQVFQEGQGGY